MALLRFQVAAQMDTLLQRDALMNTLYFNDQGFSTDASGLCSDLADVFIAGWYLNPVQITVNAYEVGSPPNYPVGNSQKNVGASPNSTCPREVAICLSYYATRNLPRQRGRIYLPVCGSTYTPGTSRPDVQMMDRALAMAQDFSDLGGLDVDWQVYSPTAGEGRNVTNAWVDDEWDTQRSRGLRPTTRRLATVSE